MRLEINQLGYSQKQRLAFIDFCLEYFGQVSRTDLAQHFSVGVTSCSRDFAVYKKLASDNLVLRHMDKLYVRTPAFKPLFLHPPQSILSNLVDGFGDGISTTYPVNSICFDAVHMALPKSHIVASLMRAITGKEALQIQYFSRSSGESKRIIVPHAIARTGHQWQVRAYDKTDMKFRDFICTCIVRARNEYKKPLKRESAEADVNWNRFVSLELRPHPKLEHHRAIELEHGMTNGTKIVQIRSTLAAYFLRYWNVDCSANQCLDPLKHLLCLYNNNVLGEIEINEAIPGYQP